jgi:hypothetical protein
VPEKGPYRFRLALKELALDSVRATNAQARPELQKPEWADPQRQSCWRSVLVADATWTRRRSTKTLSVAEKPHSL